MRNAASPVSSLNATPSSVYASTPPPIITGVPWLVKCCARARAWLGMSDPLLTVNTYQTRQTHCSSTAALQAAYIGHVCTACSNAQRVLPRYCWSDLETKVQRTQKHYRSTTGALQEHYRCITGQEAAPGPRCQSVKLWP